MGNLAGRFLFMVTPAAWNNVDLTSRCLSTTGRQGEVCTAAGGLIAMVMLTKGFLNDESGATAIEYAMIAAFIAVAIVGAVTALGTSLTGIFGNVNNDL
jgi:pilus assembly protein Flp/PilA